MEKGKGPRRRRARGRKAAGLHRATAQEERLVYSRKREAAKGLGRHTKGYFNSPLSSVAEQEEEKVTPLPSNYLVDGGANERHRGLGKRDAKGSGRETWGDFL